MASKHKGGVRIVEHGRKAPSRHEAELDNPAAPGLTVPKPPNPPAGKSVFSPGHSSHERSVRRGRSVFSPEYAPPKRRVAHEQDHVDQHEPSRRKVRSGLQHPAPLSSEDKRRPR